MIALWTCITIFTIFKELHGFVDTISNSRKCPLEQLPCEDGECIHRTRWYDERRDCGDRSDEKMFLNRNYCPSQNYIFCDDERCLPPEAKCDGFYNCRDGSDENDCEYDATFISSRKCLLEELSCRDGECIHRALWYDGTRDCADGSDEESDNYQGNCASHKSYTFCDNGRCLPPEAKCDGYRNCQDGSDEIDCGYLYMNIFEERSTQTFKEFNPSQYKRTTVKAKTWLLRKNNASINWGQDTPRAVVALALYDLNLFQDSTPHNMLIVKELQLSLAMKLLRNDTNPISLIDLSMHINAFIAACVNPRQFHGLDLVRILRERAEIEPTDRISLPAYLTLCLVNETSSSDVEKIRTLLSHNRVIYRLDVQALGLLILTCISQSPKYPNLKNETYSIAQHISRRLENKIDDTYTMALLAQALNAARFNDKAWNRTALLNTLSKERQQEDGSFGDLLATYYALPILCGKSLISLKHIQCNKVEEFANRDTSNNEKEKLVQYVLFYEDSGETFESMQLRVPKEANFFDIMKLTAKQNSNFSFKHDMREGSVLVYSIHDIPNDVERNLSWLPYIKPQNTSTWIPYKENIMELIPKDSDGVAFWFKNLI